MDTAANYPAQLNAGIPFVLLPRRLVLVRRLHLKLRLFKCNQPLCSQSSCFHPLRPFPSSQRSISLTDSSIVHHRDPARVPLPALRYCSRGENIRHGSRRRAERQPFPPAVPLLAPSCASAPPSPHPLLPSRFLELESLARLGREPPSPSPPPHFPPSPNPPSHHLN